jgi:hypothetical protein
VDITGAYLNADMSDHVLMRIKSDIAQYLVQVDPTYQGFVDPRGDIVVKLKKALYGCVQSSKLWYLNLKQLLETNNFRCTNSDTCVFVKRCRTVVIIVAIYVDDIIIQGEEGQLVEDVIELLRSAYHEVKVNRGTMHQYLGMMMDFTTPGKIIIKMSGYIQSIMEACKVSSVAQTPANRDLFDLREEQPLLSENEQKEIRSIVYQLLYVCNRVITEALLAVNFLCTRVGSQQTQSSSSIHQRKEGCWNYPLV